MAVGFIALYPSEVSLLLPGQSQRQAEAKLSSSQGLRLGLSQHRAMEPATTTLRSLNVTRRTHALVVRCRSNVPQATPIRGVSAN